MKEYNRYVCGIVLCVLVLALSSCDLTDDDQDVIRIDNDTGIEAVIVADPSQNPRNYTIDPGKSLRINKEDVNGTFFFKVCCGLKVTEISPGDYFVITDG